MGTGNKKVFCSIGARFAGRGWKKNWSGWSGQNEPDYAHIGLDKKQILFALAEGAASGAGAAFLFYRAVPALALLAFFIPLCLHRRRVRCGKQCRLRLQQQFCSGMQMVAGALAAGYSIENAWRNAERDLQKLYGGDAEFCMEMRCMNKKLGMNEPLEKILLGFAARSGCEDIWNFAEIFRYAKKSGGNLVEIIRVTLERMQEKADILTEIENAVAARRAEQRMMNLMLPGILLFITVSSPDYVESLYRTPPGILAMSVCLAGYLFACRWSEKLTDIPV